MATSKHLTIAEAVRDIIRALGLLTYEGAALASGNVLTSFGPYLESEELPAIFVCHLGQKSAVGGTNESTDWSYPIQVFICDRTPVDDPTRVDHAMSWREAIERKVEGKGLTAVTTVYQCEVAGSPILAPEFLSKYHMLVQPIFLQYISRELRT